MIRKPVIRTCSRYTREALKLLGHLIKTGRIKQTEERLTLLPKAVHNKTKAIDDEF